MQSILWLTTVCIWFGLTAIQARALEERPAQERLLVDRLQAGSSLPNVLQRRDPFLRPRNPLAPAIDTKAKVMLAEPTNRTEDPDAPELERYDATNYEVLAVLLGDVYPRALIRSPGKKVFVVREKDHLGNRSGKIHQISEGGMIVTEELRQVSGAVQRSNVRLLLKKVDETAGAGGERK